MKDFKELIEKNEPIFEKSAVEHLTEDELKLAEDAYIKLQEYIKDKNINELDEGVIGSILGGVAGFLVGPALGKIIANTLGVEKGIIFDMLTSRVVCAALGAALGKRA
jgi:uncharacterized protein YcfJ